MMFKRSLVMASMALATFLGAAAPAVADDDDRKRQRIEHRHDQHGVGRHHIERRDHDRHARSHRHARHHARHHDRHGDRHRQVRYARMDSDRDGVPNRYDRRPHNPYRH